MKSVIWLSAMLLLLSNALLAQKEARFTVSLSSDSLLLGHYFTARFSLENAQGSDFLAPDFEGFDLLAGPNVSSSIQLTNGLMNQSVTYEFVLKPQYEGLFHVAPASIRVGDAVLETQPLAVKVMPNPKGIPQPQAPQPNRRSPFDDDFFEGFNFPNWEGMFRFPEPAPLPDKQPASPPRRKTVRI